MPAVDLPLTGWAGAVVSEKMPAWKFQVPSPYPYHRRTDHFLHSGIRTRRSVAPLVVSALTDDLFINFFRSLSVSPTGDLLNAIIRP